ncbi:TIGR04222 domain-containing membrane protein [Saccharothrix sp. S26]|uniref:TIGR04222 domain-containing membrane protein n=1 Tax=Saccharothrix sp. S26 TaxID=2907215 RepID=UPI001F2DED19|nr:TIGR04222 domain-containing membrane protein [Saccharothrix sp. S26]MCE6999858.1 TIGR04222 domain-containing membrane protein [Saccharothrix sp. S26]
MTFLWWYGPALVAAVVVGLRCKRVAGAVPDRPLTFEEIGYLGGGPVRAVEVALAGLVAENRARVSGSAASAVPGEEQPATALQAVVLARLAQPRDLDELVVGAATSGPARQIGQRLVTGGLLVSPRRRLARAVLAVLPVAALAVVAVFAGPGGWVTVTALSLTGLLGVLLLLGPPPVLTRRGARAYEEATAGLAPVDPAEVTARYGLVRAPSRTAVPPVPREGSVRSATAVFDGERVEPIAPAETSQAPLPRRRRAVVVEPQRWQRRNGWLVAGGWFAGGWLAAQWLEGDDGGDSVDADFGGFGGFDA